MPYTSPKPSCLKFETSQIKRLDLPVSILSLPNDVLGCIFKYVTIKDFFECQKVCQTWRNFLIDLKNENPIVTNGIWQSTETLEYLIIRLGKFQNLKVKAVAMKVKNSFVNIAQHGMFAGINLMAIHQMDTIGQLEIKRFESLTKSTQTKERYAYNCAAAIYNIFINNQPPSLHYYEDTEEYEKDRQLMVKSLFTYIPRILSVILQGFNLYDFYTKEKEVLSQGNQETAQNIITTISYPSKLNQDKILKSCLCTFSRQLPLLPVLDTEENRYDYIVVKNHFNGVIQLNSNTEITADQLLFDKKTFFKIQLRLKELKRNQSPLVYDINLKIFKIPRILDIDFLD